MEPDNRRTYQTTPSCSLKTPNKFFNPFQILSQKMQREGFSLRESPDPHSCLCCLLLITSIDCLL